MGYDVPDGLHTWDHHDFPECPDWFDEYLVGLQERWGTHLLKVTQAHEDGEGNVIEEKEILVRYVPDKFEDRVEYLAKTSGWKEADQNFFAYFVSDDDEYEFVEGKMEAVRESFGDDKALSIIR
jgi:hypothetical protein